VSGLRALDRFARGSPRRARPRGPCCELCAAPIAEPHRHVVDLDRRSLCCSCPTCAALFTSPAAAGRFRTVPDRVLHDASSSALDDAQWSELEVPVGLAFFFFHSRQGRWVAIYPSPAGPTESELDLARWGALAAALPLARAVAPDVEALLLHRPRGGERADCLLVPIDACYELVGLVRRHWKGFDGGAAAQRALLGFFEALRRRSRPLRREGVTR